jgi:hypothetical protein
MPAGLGAQPAWALHASGSPSNELQELALPVQLPGVVALQPSIVSQSDAEQSLAGVPVHLMPPPPAPLAPPLTAFAPAPLTLPPLPEIAAVPPVLPPEPPAVQSASPSAQSSGERPSPSSPPQPPSKANTIKTPEESSLKPIATHPVGKMVCPRSHGGGRDATDEHELGEHLRSLRTSLKNCRWALSRQAQSRRRWTRNP